MDDEIIIDDEADLGDGEMTPEMKLKRLRDKLKVSMHDAADNLAGWQRAKADYVNLQKRLRDVEEEVKLSTIRKVVAGVAQLGDSLEAALLHAPTDAGLAALIKQLDTTLTAFGVTRFTPTKGEVFDAGMHEPMQTIATTDSSLDNTIESVLQSGYRMGDVVLRPARTAVYHSH